MGDVVSLPPPPPRWVGHEQHLRFVVQPSGSGFRLVAQWFPGKSHEINAFNVDHTRSDLGAHATKTSAVLEARRLRDLHAGRIVDETAGYPGVLL